jgi:hypothetical protein
VFRVLTRLGSPRRTLLGVETDGKQHRIEVVMNPRTLRNARCKTCRIVTHREPLDSQPESRHGANLRNFDPTLLESVVVRRFDGADTWTFLH